jgi:probable addiction module antidote protein
MSTTRTLRSYLSEKLEDPAEAAAYLTVALEEYESDGDREAFLLALRTVVDARGGVGALSSRTGLNRQHLYRALSGSGNPTWATMDAILSALGFRFTIEPREPHAAQA